MNAVMSGCGAAVDGFGSGAMESNVIMVGSVRQLEVRSRLKKGVYNGGRYADVMAGSTFTRLEKCG